MPLIVSPEGPGQPLPAAVSSDATYAGSDAEWPTSAASSPVSVTDGTVTVSPATSVVLSGATVTDLGGGAAGVDTRLGMPLGLTGATAATRYVGATASGAPVAGTFAAGDLCVDQSGAAWVCTAAGTPGTWAAMAGGGGGISVPSVIAFAQSGTQATSVAISAAAAGHSLLLVSDATTGQITGPACTNVTWTQLKTFTSGGSSYYALWVGVVAGGASGATVTWTKPGTYCTVMVMEVADALTPTLGASASGNNNASMRISPTAGHLVVLCGGSDNATQAGTATIGNLVALSTGSNFTAIAVAYATAAGTAFGSLSPSAGGGILAEVS